jgi:hypothetical protein
MANTELKPLPIEKLKALRARFARQPDKRSSAILARLDARIAAAQTATTTVKGK